MKRIIFFTAIFIWLGAQAKADIIEEYCTGVFGYIYANGAEYQNSMTKIWHINTGVNDKPVLIECNIDTELGNDILYIYAVDDAGNDHFIASKSGAFSWEDGLISTQLPTGKAKVVFITDCSFCGDPSEGEYYWGVESYYYADNSYSDVRYYSYDNAGNRTGRTLTLLKSSAAPQAPQPSIALSDTISEKALRIYPNPTHGMVTVEIQDYTGETQAEFRLTNMSGQLITGRKADAGTQSFDLSRQPAGIYLLQITIKGKSVVWRIIKQ